MCVVLYTVTGSTPRVPGGSSCAAGAADAGAARRGALAALLRRGWRLESPMSFSMSNLITWATSGGQSEDLSVARSSTPALACLRFDAADQHHDMVPIHGWDNKEPVLELLRAIAGICTLVENIVLYAQHALEFADDYLQHHGGVDPHGLNRQQIAALNLYTQENSSNPEQSLFRVLNRALNERERRRIVPFFPYIKLFVTSARCLTNACPVRLWRGFPQLSDEWASEYEVGKVFYWWGFSSCTKSPAVLTNASFFGSSGARTLFQIDAVLGVDLSPYSSYPEAEVLLMPGAKLKVEQVMDPSMLGGVLQVVLKQIESSHDMLRTPHPQPELEPQINLSVDLPVDGTPQPEQEPEPHGDPEPEAQRTRELAWVDDSAFTCCMKCQSNFGPLLWRHHCRGCGCLLCDSCSATRVGLRTIITASGEQPGVLGDTYRVCEDCYMANNTAKAEAERTRATLAALNPKQLREWAWLDGCRPEDIENSRNHDVPKESLTQLIICNQLRPRAEREGCSVDETVGSLDCKPDRIEASLINLIDRNQLRQRAIQQGLPPYEIAEAFSSCDMLNYLMAEHTNWVETKLCHRVSKIDVGTLVCLAQATESIKHHDIEAARDEEAPKPALMALLLGANDFRVMALRHWCCNCFRVIDATPDFDPTRCPNGKPLDVRMMECWEGDRKTTYDRPRGTDLRFLHRA